MSIAKRLILLIITIVVLLIVGNIFALQFFARTYFDDFLQTVQVELENVAQREKNEEDIAKLDQDILALISEHPERSEELLEYYTTVNSDLQRITASVEEYIEDETKEDGNYLSKYLRNRGYSES